MVGFRFRSLERGRTVLEVSAREVRRVSAAVGTGPEAPVAVAAPASVGGQG